MKAAPMAGRREMLFLIFACCLGPAHAAGPDCTAPILVYHRFGAQPADGMTVRTARFAAQLEYLRTEGYRVVPLRSVVDCLRHRQSGLPAKAVAITVDDGHRSVFTDMLPLVEQYRVPVTLFVYPSAISHATYAMTWDQLRRLAGTGLFEVQSHTYWHPNFRMEKRRLGADAYRELIRTQLEKSRRVLGQRLGDEPDMIAWPFGIHDDDLVREAAAQGFVAGFTLERRPAHTGDDPMALPRHLMVDSVGLRDFARLVGKAEGAAP